MSCWYEMGHQWGGGGSGPKGLRCVYCGMEI